MTALNCKVLIPRILWASSKITLWNSYSKINLSFYFPCIYLYALYSWPRVAYVTNTIWNLFKSCFLLFLESEWN
mgnify:CR=1 FL=1